MTRSLLKLGSAASGRLTKWSRALVMRPSPIRQQLPSTSVVAPGDVRTKATNGIEIRRILHVSTHSNSRKQQQANLAADLRCYGRENQCRAQSEFQMAFTFNAIPNLLNYHQNQSHNNQMRQCKRFMSTGHPEFTSLRLLKARKHVASIELYAPKSKNAFSLQTADELCQLMGELDQDSQTRCVVLSGHGPEFTSGVDIKSFMGGYAMLQDKEDIAHRAKLLRNMIERFQAPFKAMHSFGKPIVCVLHGLSLGLAMELAACSDIRLCSRDARMAIREVLIGIAADVGSLQLMPRLVANQSLLHELIYSGRYMTTDEALKELKFVSRVCDTKELAMEAALELAATIASRSPVAVQGSKRNLQFSRDQPFQVGLDYNAIWNAAMMQGGDVVKAIGAIMSKHTENSVDYDDL